MENLLIWYYLWILTIVLENVIMCHFDIRIAKVNKLLQQAREENLLMKELAIRFKELAEKQRQREALKKHIDQFPN